MFLNWWDTHYRRSWMKRSTRNNCWLLEGCIASIWNQTPNEGHTGALVVCDSSDANCQCDGAGSLCVRSQAAVASCQTPQNELAQNKHLQVDQPAMCRICCDMLERFSTTAVSLAALCLKIMTADAREVLSFAFFAVPSKVRCRRPDLATCDY